MTETKIIGYVNVYRYVDGILSCGGVWPSKEKASENRSEFSQLELVACIAIREGEGL